MGQAGAALGAAPRHPMRHHEAVHVADTFDYLLGRWSVHRSLVHRDGQAGTFVGTGAFTAVAGVDESARRARYQEAGSLRFGELSGQATRRLDYVAGTRGGPVAVLFGDGRLFIEVDLTAGSSTAHHRCGEDDYEITIRVLSAGVVEERWRVRGPAKAYDALTTLIRLGSSTSSPGLPDRGARL